MEFGKNIIDMWHLNKDVVFLNHGSFGATPKAVCEKYNEWQNKLNFEPLDFFLEEYWSALNTSRNKLSEFVGAKPENLVFVDNATTGVNTVLRSFAHKLKPGDEILSTNHAYTAIINSINHISRITGAKAVFAKVPFPIENETQVIDAIMKNITENTKIVVLDHITSATGLIFPVEKLCKLISAKGIITIIDGAHAPGMLILNVESIGADFYTGNCHKWLFAPKGCAFLWASDKYKDEIHPLSISLFYNQGFHREFDWTGTKDPGAWLCSGDGIEFMKSLGVERVRKYNHELTCSARNMFLEQIKQTIPSPDEMLGSLATIQMPGSFDLTNELSNQMRFKFRKELNIELFFTVFEGKLWFRISSQVYNEMSDFEKLSEALIKYFQ